MMSAASLEERELGLADLLKLVRALSDEEQLECVSEPGLLDAVSRFLLEGDRRRVISAVKVLELLTRKKSNAKRRCKTMVFGSSCFPALRDLATAGGKEAWIVITSVAGMSDERGKEAFLGSPGVPELLIVGLSSGDREISECAAMVAANVCICEAAAAAVMRDHPELVRALVDTFGTDGVCVKFKSE